VRVALATDPCGGGCACGSSFHVSLVFPWGVQSAVAVILLKTPVGRGVVSVIHAWSTGAALTVLVTQPAEHAVRLRDVIEEG